jgi:lipopolysaccharide biosynthesis glycosyltransferase
VVYPRIAWYRAVLADALEHEGRVVYLDSDVLVLHDPATLAQSALRPGDLFGAVCHPSYGQAAAECARLRLPREAPLFNSGVMVMDLEGMRRERFAESIREFVQRPDRPVLRYADQDAMNIAYAGRWTQLDPAWNCLNVILQPFTAGASWADDVHHEPWVLERAARSPAIVHFEGAKVLRPWHRRCFNPFADLYRRYRATTPWPLKALDGTRQDDVLRHLPPRLQARLWALQQARARRRPRT